MDLGLKGKTVLITGGSKGIGFACAMSFAAEGCDLHLAARNRELLETVRRTIRAAHSGVDVSLHAVDLRDGTALHDLATACGDSDILVNNAGDIPGGTIESLDESRYEELMGSVIEPQQVGDTVAFLASARAGQLSGIVLNLGP